ncbi:hypothetical protein B0H11DRAFT_1955624 [Mycena galericulata]|nr:hypothetical protein B0H11DRAFT_1955624 [Mycena galericulata]
MHLTLFLFLVPFFALLPPGYAYNSSTFPLYKNSHFRPCPTTRPSSATTPVPDKHPYALHTNGSLSAGAFCDRFWNYTVVPSTPTPGAFAMTWVNSLMNIVSAVISIFSMGHAIEQIEAEEATEAATEQTAKPGLFGRLVFWILLCYALVTTALWYRAFALMGKDYPNRIPHGLLSPVAVTTVWTYFVTLHNNPAVQLVVVLLALPQYIISITALALFGKTQASGQYIISPTYNTTAYTNCTGPVSALLHDPTDHYGVVASIIPTGFFFVVFPVVVFYSLAGEAKTAATGNALAACIVCFMSLVYSLPITASRAKSPIAWDPGCGLVHVMMGSGYGYWDVKGEEDWTEATALWSRIVSGIFTVYF